MPLSPGSWANWVWSLDSGILESRLRSARVAQVSDLALKKVQCMWRQDWHKCRTRKGCITLDVGMYARVWDKIWTCTLSGLEIHGMYRSVFFEKRIEGSLAGLLVRGARQLASLAAAPLSLFSHLFDLVWTAGFVFQFETCNDLTRIFIQLPSVITKYTRSMFVS